MKSGFNGYDDKNLLLVAERELQRLIDTGGSSFTMRIPADPSRDTDLIFSEVLNRLKNHSAALVDIALWSDRLSEEWGDPGGRAFEALKISNVTVFFCRKCGGRCKPSEALNNPICGSPEFSDGDMAGATLSLYLKSETPFKLNAPQKKFRAFIEGFGFREFSLSELVRSPNLCHEIQAREVVEFVGFHDKNGKPVFEGDVLRVVKNVNAWHWDNLNNSTADTPNESDYRVGVVLKERNDAKTIVAFLDQPAHILGIDGIKYLETVEFYSDGNNDWDTLSASDLTYSEVLGNVFQSSEFLKFRDIYSFYIA